MKNFICGCLWLSLFTLKPEASLVPVKAASLFEEKGRAEEIITKHLAAVGAPETRASITTRIISGTCEYRLRNGQAGSLKGPAVIASDSNRLLFAANFQFPDYPFEKLAFDGQKLTTGYIQPGVRTTLGNIFLSEKAIMSEGLFGGVLSSAWPMFEASFRKAKLEYAGTKEIDGRRLQLIRYNPKKGADASITLYFDSSTFFHVRTEFVKVIAARMGANVDASSRQNETRLTITEDFSDFKKEAGLNLPHTHKFRLLISGARGTNEYEWLLRFNQFSFNQLIPAESFNVETSVTAK